MHTFFDGTNFLKTLDKNGKSPELFIVCSRVRGPGKTYFFSKKLISDFFEKGEKFVLLTRFNKDLGCIAEGVFKEMVNNEFPGWRVFEKVQMKGSFSRVILEKDEKEIEAGYVIPLNAADTIKRISSLFTDASQAYFDEFQPETGQYLSDEVDKFLSIHGSIARGGKKSRRYLPVYFTSNTISILNPYFTALGLTNKLQENTKKYKGDGFVYMRAENPGLVTQHAEAGMSRAFMGNKSIDYSDDTWMLDDKTGICKPDNWGSSFYVATLRDGSKSFGVRCYVTDGIFYLSHSVDQDFPVVYNLHIDGGPNPALKTSRISKKIREAIEKGTMRFDSLESKRIALDVLC